MSFYGRVFARIYDPFLGLAERAGMRELRRQALTGAHGRVLEIGAGTGLNLPCTRLRSPALRWPTPSRRWLPSCASEPLAMPAARSWS